ncbi:GIY-YIG nuclease family protein [Hydrocarboniphaga sp.]|uniref:GIY-YIG nuclease family protein n=1 Tax=Hydrocarboniphaga sp. TaxID=2033016 RepID=UPI00260C1F81|nr:GIY-YIG nuclease family protein [Hydrocarboniphaga sp.]
MASQRNGTLYVGVTSDLVRRVWQHRNGTADGFTQQHGIKTLVGYEQHQTMESAIGREKAIKKWKRARKLALIEKDNATWRDLWPDISGAPADCLDSRLRGNDGFCGRFSLARTPPPAALVQHSAARRYRARTAPAPAARSRRRR